MRKKMMLIAVAAFLAAIALSSQPYNAAAQKDGVSQDEGKPEPVCQRDCYTTTNTEKADDHPPHWYTPLEKPDGMLVIVGAVTCGIIIWQTVQTKRAAKATEVAAKAALLQADHLAASERAWVTVAPRDRSPVLYPSWQPGSALPVNAPIQNPVHHQLPLLIRNMGKTPAQIDEFACRYIRIASMAELPDEPDYGVLSPQGGQWIIPNDEHNGSVDLETDQGVLYRTHITDLESRNAFLYAFGILKYRDVYGEPHQTRFGFLYHFPIPGIVGADGSHPKAQFRKDGPEKYNYAD